MVVRISRIIGLCFFVTLSAGCSDIGSPSAMVAGKVTLNGVPFSGAAVHFYHPKVGGGAFNLNENGEFVSTRPIPVAEYFVSLDRPGPSAGEDPSKTVWPTDKSGEIPTRYRSSAKSGFVARVVDGDNNQFIFDMMGKPTSQKTRKGPTVIEPLSEFAG